MYFIYQHRLLLLLHRFLTLKRLPLSEELFFDVTVQGAKANGYWRKVIVKGNHDRNDDKSDAAKRSEFFFFAERELQDNHEEEGE